MASIAHNRRVAHRALQEAKRGEEPNLLDSWRVRGNSDAQQRRAVDRNLFLLRIGNDEVLHRYLILAFKEASDRIQIKNRS